MKRACIDTHALIWYLSRPARLGRAALRLLRAADAGKADVLVPSIVGIELCMLRDAGRRTVGVPELEALLSIQPAFTLLPLDLPYIREFSGLESITDPFDRLIVSAARVRGVPLITADAKIHDSMLVDVIWD